MIIRSYPSRLSGESLEAHKYGVASIRSRLVINAEGYKDRDVPPLTVEAEGPLIPPGEWTTRVIRPDSDVRLHPAPLELEAATIVWIGIGISAIAAAYSSVLMSTIDTGGCTSSTGRSLDLNPARANTAKLGDAVREVFGRVRIYPDYVMQPVTRFDATGPMKVRVQMLLCLGIGELIYTNGDIRAGSTPASTLLGFNITHSPPGVDVPGNERSENWANPAEVGGTSSGTGLDMAQTSSDVDDIIADSITISGSSVTFMGLDTDDDDDNNENDNALPPSWVAGAVAELKAPANYQITTVAGYSVIASPLLTEIAPVVGMPVMLGFGSADYDLFTASYIPGQAAVPGIGGSAAEVQAGAVSTIYDLSISSSTSTITWQGVTCPVSLVTNYVSMSGLLTAITEGLTGSGLVVRDNGGTVLITESASPFAGGAITSSSLPAVVFGDAPVYTSGMISTGGSPAVTANVTPVYNSTTGTALSGMPGGVQWLSLAHRGSEHRIVPTDGTTATVARLANGAVDEPWPGFIIRTMIDYEATGLNDTLSWLRSFLACPENETVDMFKMNFSFPNGICGLDSKGRKRPRYVEWEIQYCIYGSGAGWVSHQGECTLKNVNELGLTERITLSLSGLVEARCHRCNEQGSNNVRDLVYQQVLRGRLLTRPSSYPDMSLMAMIVGTGGKSATQLDCRVNVVATRVYDPGTARAISGVLLYAGNSLGLEMDVDTINASEFAYWTPRGEYFDFATGDSISALEMLQKTTAAGKSYFLLSDRLASVGREGVKNQSGITSPHEMTEELQTSFTALSADDYDGADVTYINDITWTEETVKCRTPDNSTPVKIENYKFDGVLNQDHAYQIGMRRLMKYLHQRLGHNMMTELDALVYGYGDHILLIDDVPGNKTVSRLVVDMATMGIETVLTVSEQLDWTFENLRVILRYQDGSVSGLLEAVLVGDYQLSISWQAAFNEIILNNSSIEPP